LRQESSLRHYPAKLRHIPYVDPDTGKSFIFLTNNFGSIAEFMGSLQRISRVFGCVDGLRPAGPATLRMNRAAWRPRVKR